MKVKVENKKYWARDTKDAPFTFVYRTFLDYIRNEYDLQLTITHLFNQLKKQKEEEDYLNAKSEICSGIQYRCQSIDNS